MKKFSRRVSTILVVGLIAGLSPQLEARPRQRPLGRLRPVPGVSGGVIGNAVSSQVTPDEEGPPGFNITAISTDRLQPLDEIDVFGDFGRERVEEQFHKQVRLYRGERNITNLETVEWTPNRVRVRVPLGLPPDGYWLRMASYHRRIRLGNRVRVTVQPHTVPNLRLGSTVFIGPDRREAALRGSPIRLKKSDISGLTTDREIVLEFRYEMQESLGADAIGFTNVIDYNEGHRAGRYRQVARQPNQSMKGFGSKLVRARVTIPPKPGGIVIRLDADNDIPEVNETDNDRGFSIDFSEPMVFPDLVVSQLTSIAPVSPGDPFSTEVTVRNQGDGASSVSVVAVYVGGATEPVRTRGVPSLQPGRSHRFRFDGTAPSRSGSYLVRAVANHGNSVLEWNGENNTTTTELTVR